VEELSFGAELLVSLLKIVSFDATVDACFEFLGESIDAFKLLIQILQVFVEFSISV
jgi:hypothetical protein